MDDVGAVAEESPPESPTNPSTIATSNAQRRPAHQRLVLTDPVAFRYLEEDPSITVLERRRRLQGYELYIVEQWICSRVHPSFVITTYTGLEQHSVLVGILSVPTNEDEWSPRLRVWFKALAKFHARKKETPLGTLMVTNLSSFPSALTVIPVPEGDVKKHREDFFVNENLKRLGCSGRAGLNLVTPASATQAKFQQLYHTSDRITLYGAVIELVKLCQVALVLYGKLAPEYADGLLCDITEQGINDWWSDLGSEYFNVDPTDGILGPTTVSALLGILMGARNRLHAYGAPVAKDVFDVMCTKRGIAYFQKSQKLERTRRVDRKTLHRLHRVTAKAASGDGWTMPRAVKTTVAELSGKGGDMVMGRTGSREKAGIADVETLDIETFVSLLSGERSKWLWYGKPRKTNSDEFRTFNRGEGVMFTKDENGNYIWTTQKRESVDDTPLHGIPSRIYSHQSHGSQASIGSPEKDQASRRNLLKTVSGRVTDARSGFGRIKDAVGIPGFRGHHHTFSKEDNILTDEESFTERPQRQDNDESKILTGEADFVAGGEDAISLDEGSADVSPTSPPAADQQRDSQGLEKPWPNIAHNKPPAPDAASLASSESMALKPLPENRQSISLTSADNQLALDLDADLARVHSHTSVQRTKGSKAFPKGSDMPPSLRRTESVPQAPGRESIDRNAHRLPRHLSFSTFVDVVAPEDGSGWLSVASDEVDEDQDPDRALLREKTLAFETQSMAKKLHTIKVVDGPLVERKVDEVMALDKQATRDHELINKMYCAKMEETNNLREATDDLLTEEKATLTERLKDVETLEAKLEYELNALQSKVEDMENGVADFERQVKQLEGRAEELNEKKPESWSAWWYGVMMGKSQA